MGDYLDLIEKNRSGGIEHAATVPVFYEDARRGDLTPRRKRAKLSSSASVTKRAARSKTKSSSSSSRKTPKMAKRKTSAKQKAAARRNIKKAQAAKRAKARARSAAGKKAARTRARTKSTRKAARRAAPKRAKSKRSKSKSKSRKSPRRARRSGKRRSRKTKRSMSMRVPKKTKKVYVVAAEKPRRKRRKSRKSRKAAEHPRRRRSRGSSRRRGAMENPMTGVELFVGGITGLFGFGVADAIDRVLATHALTDKNAKDANGYELYADNPPTSGDYTGLFNATAICSPMDWKRWVFGLVGASVPLTIAHFVSAPTGRAALQFFGFGYGIRIVGKGLIDGLAALSVHTGTGQRLYDGEMRAAVLKANNGNNQADALASLPSAGLGAVKQIAAPCKDCDDKQQAAAGAKQGAGYPSMPREVAPSNQMTQTKAPTPSGTYPNPPPPPPEGFNPGPLTGVPKNGVAVKKNPFAWGTDSPDYRD